jgi:hypothetical protein
MIGRNDIMTYKPRWRYTAEEFDNKFGTQYSRRWNMPEGKDETELYFERFYVNPYVLHLHQNGNFSYEQEQMRSRLYFEIIELNPELKDHPWIGMGSDVRGTMRYVVCGVLSRFNKEDIFEFITTYDRVKLDKWGRLQQRYNFDAAGWVPSRKNFREIQNMLRSGKRLHDMHKDNRVLWACDQCSHIMNDVVAMKTGMLLLKMKGWRTRKGYRPL